ncbi:MAG TPA: helix-turn-helix transcriptional regulator [Streptosporangiaceae bacterium]|nr:helix-turn-helix transcriptional regulator [Streptosporangiaceae bacterium]
MPVGGKPTVRSRRVGAELRRLREAAGVTTAQAAELLTCSPAKISRIENGIVTVRVVDLRLLLDRYGDQDPERRAYLERLARDSNKRGWWQDYGDTIPPYYADFIGLETDANYIKTWEPTIVPGLLQTPEYARAVMLANPAMISPDKLDNLISIRQARQARLEQGTDVRLDAVIWEAAVITTIGGDEVQRGQLARLLELMNRPNISVQVLPLEAGDKANMSGSFVTFSFGSERSVSTVFVETLTSSQYLEGDQELRGYTLVFDALRSAALSPAASATRISQRLEQRQ